MPNFAPRDLIHQEGPYCVAVDHGVLEYICSYCLYWKKCQPCECRLIHYCSESCKTQDAPDHEIECLLSREKGCHSLLLDSEIRLGIRALNKHHRETLSDALSEGTFYESRRTILDLETHLDDLSEDERKEVYSKAQDIYTLVEGLIPTTVDDAVLMLQRLRINMFQLSDHKAVAKGVACYLGISVVDHTCEDNGNFVLAFKGRDIILKAMKKFTVPDMSQFRISYLDPTIPYEKRHEVLSQTYHFDCQCAKCLMDSKTSVGSGAGHPDLEALFASRYSNRKWLKKGKKLLQELETSAHSARAYRRDLCSQIQLAALNLGLYEESLQFGIKALKEVKVLHRGEASLVSLCIAMRALGWDNPAHGNHKRYDSISRITVSLLSCTYGDDFPAIEEVRDPSLARCRDRAGMRESRTVSYGL